MKCGAGGAVGGATRGAELRWAAILNSISGAQFNSLFQTKKKN